MSFEIVEKSQVNREITITVSGNEIRRAEGHMVESARRSMVLKGFRKGKVPASVVRERAGASIMEDARRECLQNTAREALSTLDKLLHVGEAEIVEAQTEDGGFVARLHAEVEPTVEVKPYKDLTVKVADVKVTDEDVENAIQKRLERRAKVETVEGRDVVEDGDIVTCELSAPNEAASKLCRAGERSITVGRGNINVDMEKCLVGSKIGDSVQMTAKIGDEEPVVTAQIKEIKTRVLPELNDAFAKETGDAETVEGLREFERKNLLEEAENARKNEIDAKLCDKLCEAMPIDIPEGYVRARAIQAYRLQLEQWTGQQINEELLARLAANMKDSEIVEYRKDYHVEVILNAIADAEKIEVSNEEIVEEATKWFGNASKAQIEKWLKTSNASHFVGDQVKRDRALAIIRDSAHVESMTEEEIAAEKAQSKE